MAVYFFLYGILAFLAIVSMRSNCKSKAVKCCSFVCFFLLLLIVGLRDISMGSDLGDGRNTGYIASFYDIGSMSWQELWELDSFLNYEKGFVILNKLISTIFPNAHFYLLVIALLTFAPVFSLVNRESMSPVFSTIVYLGLPVFLISFSALRQCQGVSAF